MKVFLDGSHSLSYIDKPVEDRLLELVGYDAEFVIVDKPGASRVMIDFLKAHEATNIAVKSYSASWRHLDEDRERKIRAYFPSSKELRDYKDLADNADMVLLVWDGEDARTFIEAINAISFKACNIELYSPYTGTILRVSRYSDLYAALPPEKEGRVAAGEVSDSDYADCLKMLLSSGEVLEHALSLPKSKSKLIMVIAASPKPLEQKLHVFEELAQGEDFYRDYLDEVCERFESGDDAFIYRDRAGMRGSYSFRQCAKEVREALRALTLSQGEVLILGEKSYPDDPDNVNNFFGYDGFAPFLSLDAVKQHIRSEWDGIEEGEDDILCWYQLEKWIPWVGGLMGEAYTYLMIKDEVVYFNRNHPREEAIVRDEIWMSERSIFSGWQFFTLPLPYELGDIVKIDARPFAPVAYVCLFVFWGFHDGDIAALCRKNNGNWVKCNSLGMLADFLHSEMSLCFCLQRVEDIPPEYELLYDIRRFVDKDNYRGEALWYALRSEDQGKDEWSEEEIREILKELPTRLANEAG